MELVGTVLKVELEGDIGKGILVPEGVTQVMLALTKSGDYGGGTATYVTPALPEGTKFVGFARVIGEKYNDDLFLLVAVPGEQAVDLDALLPEADAADGEAEFWDDGIKWEPLTAMAPEGSKVLALDLTGSVVFEWSDVSALPTTLDAATGSSTELR